MLLRHDTNVITIVAFGSLLLGVFCFSWSERHTRYEALWLAVCVLTWIVFFADVLLAILSPTS